MVLTVHTQARSFWWADSILLIWSTSTSIERYTQKRAMSLYRSLLVVKLDGHRNCLSIPIVLIIDMYISIRVHFDNLPYLHLSSFPFLSRKGRHLVEVQAHGKGLHSFLGGKGMQITPYHAPAHVFRIVYLWVPIKWVSQFEDCWWASDLGREVAYTLRALCPIYVTCVFYCCCLCSEPCMRPG